MATPTLTTADYRAIGEYAFQHKLKAQLSALPYIHFTDAAGAETRVLLSHIRAEVDEEKSTKKKRNGDK